MSEFAVHQESDEVATKSLVRVAIVSLIVAAVGVFFAGLLVVAGTGTLRPDFAGASGRRPAPRELSQIEQTPIWQSRTGIDMRRAQLRELSSWGWVDRKARVAKIPIDEAMDLVAQGRAPAPLREAADGGAR
jgi:hypothetical protein